MKKWRLKQFGIITLSILFVVLLFPQQTFAFWWFIIPAAGYFIAENAPAIASGPFDFFFGGMIDWIMTPSKALSAFNVRMLDVRLPLVNYPFGTPFTPETWTVGTSSFNIIEQPMIGGYLAAPAGIFKMWHYMSGIANLSLLLILVVIGFLVMTRFQVKNYSYKVMLPRFFISVVLVQFSWFIAILLFDVMSAITLAMQDFAFNSGTINCAELVNRFPTASFPSWVDGIEAGGSGVGNICDLNISMGDIIAGGLIEHVMTSVKDTYDLSFTLGNPLLFWEDVKTAWGTAAPDAALVGGWLFTWSFIGIGGILMLMITLLLSNIVFLGFTIIRIFALYILVIVGPVVFAVSIFPAMKGMRASWFKFLIGLLMVEPLAYAIFTISYTIALSI